MAEALEFIRPDDRPAILALSNAEYAAMAHAALMELDYKVHAVADYDMFVDQYQQIQYQVVVIDEHFGGASSIVENHTLAWLQYLPMNLRRHSVIFLIGPSFSSLSAMQAFQQSVHAVINPSELTSLQQIILKYVSDNDLFLNQYREVQKSLAAGQM